MGSKRTTDELLTCIDTTPNPDDELSAPIAPETPTPDETFDTASEGSWVWQYFKQIVIDGTPYNVCQASIEPGGTDLCLKQLTVDQKKSTTSMANHLDCKHPIYDRKVGTGAITNFLDKAGQSKSLDLGSGSILRWL
ncbi:hypothetical protein Pst134EB_008749 [Puccinia striiformis f. sp. tritici]|nr:hypothetical protein Pst134EB_008749 [Puccinia striiformis f. sp. tritici]